MNHTTLKVLDSKAEYEARLVEQYGPKPVNVFKSLRQSIDVSHETLARMMFVSKQCLIRLEQGCYEEPLPIVVDFWTNKRDMGISELRLRHQYEDFQEQTRLRHKGYFGSRISPGAELVPIEKGFAHPLVWMRMAPRHKPDNTPCRDFGVSVTEVAKALCVSQATLQHWETKWKLQKSVPKTFQTALMQLGYPTQQVTMLNNYYIKWREVNK